MQCSGNVLFLSIASLIQHSLDRAIKHRAISTFSCPQYTLGLRLSLGSESDIIDIFQNELKSTRDPPTFPLWTECNWCRQRRCAPSVLLQERDKSGSGYINYEQLEEIYRVYQVCWTGFLFVFHRETSVGPLRLI